MHRVRKTEGEWCSTSKGVTIEYPEVRHDMTGWIAVTSPTLTPVKRTQRTPMHTGKHPHEHEQGLNQC